MKLALILICLFSTICFAQDVQHAPTLQSCVADLNLWTSQIPGWPRPADRDAFKSLTVHEMQGRILSLGDCDQAYPNYFDKSKAGELPASFSLVNSYAAEIQERLFNFLDRHALADKFAEEDEAGKR